MVDGSFCFQVEYYPDKVFDGLDPNMVLETKCEGLDGEPWVILENKDDRDVCSTVDVDSALVYPKVADSLANLGFYARTLKPPDAWWNSGMLPLSRCPYITEHHPTCCHSLPTSHSLPKSSASSQRCPQHK